MRYIALILLLAVCAGAQQPPATDLAIQADYERYNQKFFGGRLPPVPIIYDPMTEEADLWGFAICTPTATRVWKPKEIRLNPSLQRAGMARPRFIYLLHEMVHLDQCLDGQPMFHDDDFQLRMRSLANRGAFENLW